ncbi:GNAT family N-acetyltransferase [Bacillus sp. 03113]|uniref:GNAT family N-acetyltransferase n=1 Tax=Bacillus sp. 03113 TaxID=2578211 RepID=UPI001142B05C|nr:GNAT family N-acetyltransferase [Bacillus sp. 03113]
MKPYLLTQRIEELSMNALPAISTVLYDGWVLRFSNGYTRRANSVNPIYPSSENVESKIDTCEKLFHQKNLSVVFKITDHVFPEDLDDVLQERGYDMDSETSVQQLDLLHIEEPSNHNVEWKPEWNEKWFKSYCTLNQVSEKDQPTLKKMLMNLVPECCFIMLKNNNDEVIACGLGILEDGFMGLYDIVTDETCRKQGYGKQLVLNLLQWGKRNGANQAYLQVMLNNQPALKLYAQVGFKEKYKYWYRLTSSPT